MKLFSGWFGVDISRNVDEDLESNSSVPEVTKKNSISDDKLFEQLKKEHRRIEATKTILQVKAIDNNLFEVLHKGHMGEFLGFRNVLLDARFSSSDLLEYLITVKNAEIEFTGPVETILQILDNRMDAWFLWNTIILTATDGLANATERLKNDWKKQVLRICSAYRRFLSQIVRLSPYCRIEGNNFQFYVLLDNITYTYLVVNCSSMNLTAKEVLRFSLFGHAKTVNFHHRKTWQMAMKIIREEAVSYVEKHNNFEYLFEEKQRVATFITKIE